MLRRSLILGLLVLFVLEVFLIVQVGHAIGFGLTFLLLLAGCVAGGLAVRREGSRAFRALQGALAGGQGPEREVTDSAVAMVGGLLLMVPGFITDVLGLLVLLPVTRPLLRRAAARLVGRGLRTGRERAGVYAAQTVGLDDLFGPQAGAPDEAYGPPAEGQVIRGTIVREDRPEN